MAKDDCFAIVYKILAYLYVQLKSGEPVDEKLISSTGILYDINETCWTYIWVNLIDSGYVSGTCYENVWGNQKLIQNVSPTRITSAGIEYLCKNSRLKKAVEYLKDIKALTPCIQTLTGLFFWKADITSV